MHAQLHLLRWSVAATLAILLSSGQTEMVTPPVNIPSTLNGLTITSMETQLNPGVTDEVKVTCKYSKSNSTQIMSVISLIMSRWINESKTSQELLSINSFKPDAVSVVHDLGSAVDGRLQQNGESFLSLTLSAPGKDVESLYTCEANTIDNLGHPINIRVGLKLRIKTAHVPDVMHTLQELSTKLALQSHQLDMQTELINNLTRNDEQQNKVLNEQKITIENLNKSLQRAHELLFVTYSVNILDSSRYYLMFYWANMWFGFEEAKAACKETGGKLAELSFQELKNKETELKAAGLMPLRFFWIGLTRYGEGFPWEWVSRGANVGNVTWSRRPKSDEHCAAYTPGPNCTGYIPFKCNYSNYVLCTRPLY